MNVIAKVENVRCELADADDYINVLNGIAVDLHRYGYCEGSRNQCIVDMTMSAYMLGLDPRMVLDCFAVDTGLVDPTLDDEDPWDRMYRVLDYTHAFCWDWLVEPDDYLTMAEEWDDEVPLRFVIQ